MIFPRKANIHTMIDIDVLLGLGGHIIIIIVFLWYNNIILNKLINIINQTIYLSTDYILLYCVFLCPS